MASSAKSGLADSICLAKQADLEAVAFSSGTGRRLARAANGLGFRGLGFRVGGFGRGVRGLVGGFRLVSIVWKVRLRMCGSSAGTAI